MLGFVADSGRDTWRRGLVSNSSTLGGREAGLSSEAVLGGRGLVSNSSTLGGLAGLLSAGTLGERGLVSNSSTIGD